MAPPLQKVRGLWNAPPALASQRVPPPKSSCLLLQNEQAPYNRNLLPAASGLDLLGRSLVFRVGRADRDHGDDGVAEIAGVAGAAALRPLAPVHPRARRTGAGVEIGWTRRTRVDGDSWEVAEVPLGEEREAYRLEVMNGTGVVRRAEVNAPSFLYAAADEIADFGAPQPFLDVRIAQLSTSVGPGAWREARLAP